MAGAPDAPSPVVFYGKSPAKRPKRSPTKGARRHVKYCRLLVLNSENVDQP
jgi:hypothetical protein